MEELIEYGQIGYEDFEMRSGDFVAFIYVGRPPAMRVTQNLTIGTRRIVATDQNLVEGLVLVGSIVVVIIGLVVWWFSSSLGKLPI